MHKIVVVLRFDDVYRVLFFIELLARNKRMAIYCVFRLSSFRYC